MRNGRDASRARYFLRSFRQEARKLHRVAKPAMRRTHFPSLPVRVPRCALLCSFYRGVNLARTPRPVHRKPVPLSRSLSSRPLLLPAAISSAVSRYSGGMQRYSAPTARRLHRTCVACLCKAIRRCAIRPEYTPAGVLLSKNDPHGLLFPTRVTTRTLKR